MKNNKLQSLVEGCGFSTAPWLKKKLIPPSCVYNHIFVEKKSVIWYNCVKKSILIDRFFFIRRDEGLPGSGGI